MYFVATETALAGWLAWWRHKQLIYDCGGKFMPTQQIQTTSLETDLFLYVMYILFGIVVRLHEPANC